MLVRWLGQSCIRIELKDGSILIDPFSPDAGIKPPRIRDTMVLSSHAHPQHSQTPQFCGPEITMIKGPGEYQKNAIMIQGVSAFHDTKNGSIYGLTTLFRLSAEGIHLCHLGGLGQDILSNEQVAALPEIDVCFIPVGGHAIIDAAQAARIVQQLEPKIVIPIHYRIEGVKETLQSVEPFLKEIGIEAQKADRLKIQQKTLPQEETELFLLNANV